MFIGDKRGLDAVALTGLHGKHDVDKGIAAAKPSHQRSVGAQRLRQAGGIPGSDFFAVRGLEANALENDAAEVQIPPMSLTQAENQRVILLVPGGGIITAPRPRGIHRHSSVKELIGMDKGRHGIAQGKSVIANTGMHMLRVGDATLNQHDFR